MDQRRIALRKTPPDLKKAAQLLEQAEALIDKQDLTDDEIKSANY